MYSKSDSIVVMACDNPEKNINKLFVFLFRYQNGLETQTRESDFIFDCVNLPFHKCHKINFKCGGLYIDCLKRIKKKKTTINS